MERRLLLVFALTFLVIILFQPLLKKYLPQAADSPGDGAGSGSVTAPGHGGHGVATYSSCRWCEQAGCGGSRDRRRK